MSSGYSIDGFYIPPLIPNDSGGNAYYASGAAPAPILPGYSGGLGSSLGSFNFGGLLNGIGNIARAFTGSPGIQLQPSQNLPQTGTVGNLPTSPASVNTSAIMAVVVVVALVFVFSKGK